MAVQGVDTEIGDAIGHIGRRVVGVDAEGRWIDLSRRLPVYRPSGGINRLAGSYDGL